MVSIWGCRRKWWWSFDDYARFVKSLGLDDHWDGRADADDDDEEEFLLEAMEDDDDEMMMVKRWRRNGMMTKQPRIFQKPNGKRCFKEVSSAMERSHEWDPEFYQELEEELIGLEEDMEAAVALLGPHQEEKYDEDIQLQILVMKGLSRLNGREEVPKSAQSSRISKVLLPIPSADGSSISDCRDNGAV
jgi:hypothetical protein